jgi:hypothetical protein
MAACGPKSGTFARFVVFADRLEAIPGSTTSPLVAALRFDASSLLETSARLHREPCTDERRDE